VQPETEPRRAAVRGKDFDEAEGDRTFEHLDLLVCGSRGYGPLRAVLLGGVSRRVAAEAHCPVIVLPRGLRSSLESLVA
jgi:nucleotide-binding universal stress UspA family protein